MVGCLTLTLLVGCSAAEKPVEQDTIAVEVKNSRKALAVLAAKFYGEPSKGMVIIGVTGTNGKTTVTYIVESMLLKAGFKTGVIGTVNSRYGGKTYENSMYFYSDMVG